jgi:hypothetical protein
MQEKQGQSSDILFRKHIAWQTEYLCPADVHLPSKRRVSQLYIRGSVIKCRKNRQGSYMLFRKLIDWQTEYLLPADVHLPLKRRVSQLNIRETVIKLRKILYRAARNTHSLADRIFMDRRYTFKMVIAVMYNLSRQARFFVGEFSNDR